MIWEMAIRHTGGDSVFLARPFFYAKILTAGKQNPAEAAPAAYDRELHGRQRDPSISLGMT